MNQGTAVSTSYYITSSVNLKLFSTPKDHLSTNLDQCDQTAILFAQYLARPFITIKIRPIENLFLL